MFHYRTTDSMCDVLSIRALRICHLFDFFGGNLNRMWIFHGYFTTWKRWSLRLHCVWVMKGYASGVPLVFQKDGGDQFLIKLPGDFRAQICCALLGFVWKCWVNLPNEIAIFHRDNDQQNHWVLGYTIFRHTHLKPLPDVKWITIWLWLTVRHGSHHHVKNGTPSISIRAINKPWLC